MTSYAMRTTLNLDDDVVELLKDYAESRSVALGRAASELVRRGLEAPVQTRMVNGFHAVVLPANSPKVTSEKVRELLEDEV
jgi:negative regulator of replication initiation